MLPKSMTVLSIDEREKREMEEEKEISTEVKGTMTSKLVLLLLHGHFGLSVP